MLHPPAPAERLIAHIPEKEGSEQRGSDRDIYNHVTIHTITLDQLKED